MASKRWEEELLQKQREGLARQRYREVKADREKEARSITGLARQRVEILEGTDSDKQIVAENSKILETATEVASTIAKTTMEYQPAVIASKVVTGRDLDGNEISAGERLIEASAFIPIGKVVDVSYDAVKGTAKLANGEQFPGFFESFFLIGSFQADAFAFMLDLITEVVGATFLFLINGSDVEFDFAFLSHLTHSSYDKIPLRCREKLNFLRV